MYGKAMQIWFTARQLQMLSKTAWRGRSTKRQGKSYTKTRHLIGIYECALMREQSTDALRNFPPITVEI